MTTEMTKEQVEQLLGNTPEDFAEADKEAKEPRVASPAQIKYYADLCTQKGQTFDESIVSGGNINAEIQRLKTLPYWKAVSAKQEERIIELCTLLNLPTPDLTTLNGAYDGSASKFIQKLQEMSKNVVLPITEKQFAMISQMNFCPDCEPIEVEGLSSKDASEYIAHYKDAFYGWKKTRLSAKQFSLIETLTERQGSKLSYEAIIQFDEGTATKYIDQLEMELADKSMLETTLEPEDMYAMKNKDQEDARNELRNLVAKLYASIGQELENEFYETMDWNSLKELVDFVKLFGVNVSAMFDRVEIFTAEQKEMLLA